MIKEFSSTLRRAGNGNIYLPPASFVNFAGGGERDTAIL